MMRIVNSAGEPAFASACSEGIVSEGLTKREYFAALAMQGMLAAYSGEQALPGSESLAEDAVGYADALLAELATEAPHADD